MSFPLAFQQEPREDWSEWFIVGGRATGKSFGMQMMALRRALHQGERVAYVVAPGGQSYVFDALRRLALSVTDTTAWDIRPAVREIRAAASGGLVAVISVNESVSIRGRQLDDAVFDDIRSDRHGPDLALMEEYLRLAGVKRVARAIWSQIPGSTSVESGYTARDAS